MAQTTTKSFTGVGVGTGLSIRQGQYVVGTVSGTFSGVVVVERSRTGGITFSTHGTYTAGASFSFLNESKESVSVVYRFRVDSYVSGTIVTSLSSVPQLLKSDQSQDGNALMGLYDDGYELLVRPNQITCINESAKAGTTAGFVVNPTDNKGILATCPASKTASTLVVPIQYLKEAFTIVGFKLNGNILSAGATVTLDAQLRSLAPAAVGSTDAAVTGGAITQLSVTANTLLTPANSGIATLSQLVGAGISYYLLITVTTGLTSSVEIDSVSVIVNEA